MAVRPGQQLFNGVLSSIGLGAPRTTVGSAAQDLGLGDETANRTAEELDLMRKKKKQLAGTSVGGQPLGGNFGGNAAMALLGGPSIF